MQLYKMFDNILSDLLHVCVLHVLQRVYIV